MCVKCSLWQRSFLCVKCSVCSLYNIYDLHRERERKSLCWLPHYNHEEPAHPNPLHPQVCIALDNVYISGWVFFFRLPVPPDNRSFNDVIGLIFVTRSVPQPVPPSRWATHTHRWGPAIQSMSKMAAWVYHLRLSRVYVRLTIHPFSHPIISVCSPLMFCTGVEGNWMATGDRGACTIAGHGEQSPHERVNIDSFKTPWIRRSSIGPAWWMCSVPGATTPSRTPWNLRGLVTVAQMRGHEKCNVSTQTGVFCKN